MSMTILSTRKPPQVVAPVEARVEVTGSHSMDEVIDFGLKALGETRSSLFGYGIRGDYRRDDTIDVRVVDDTVTVYGNRD